MIIRNQALSEHCKQKGFMKKNSGRKLVVFDGLMLNNKLTLIIFFFNTIHLSRSIKITDNLTKIYGEHQPGVLARTAGNQNIRLTFYMCITSNH